MDVKIILSQVLRTSKVTNGNYLSSVFLLYTMIIHFIGILHAYMHLITNTTMERNATLILSLTCTPKLANMNMKPNIMMVAFTRFLHPFTISPTMALIEWYSDMMCKGLRHLMMNIALHHHGKNAMLISTSSQVKVCRQGRTMNNKALSCMCVWGKRWN